MRISRCDKQKEKMLTTRFKADILSLTSLVPGNYKNINEIKDDNEYDFMSHEKLKKNIEEKFGKSNNSVNGKVRNAKLFAFEFKNEIMLCTIEGDGIGTKWYWVDSPEEGSRYGKAMLLPSDKKISSFWPEFCETFKDCTE